MKALYIIDVEQIPIPKEEQYEIDKIYRGVNILKDECHLKIGICNKGETLNEAKIDFHEITIYYRKEGESAEKCLELGTFFNVEEYHFAGSNGALAVKTAIQAKLHTKAKAILWVDCIYWAINYDIDGPFSKESLLRAAREKGVEIRLYCP